MMKKLLLALFCCLAVSARAEYGYVQYDGTNYSVPSKGVTNATWGSSTNGLASTNWVNANFLTEAIADTLYDVYGASANASNGVLSQIVSSNYADYVAVSNIVVASIPYPMTYYLDNSQTGAVAGAYLATDTLPTATTTQTWAGVTNNQYLGTNVVDQSITTWPAGEYEMDVWAYVNAITGTKRARIGWDGYIWSNGVEIVDVENSEVSAQLTTTPAKYAIRFNNTNDVAVPAGGRSGTKIVVKEIIGSGSDPTIYIITGPSYPSAFRTPGAAGAGVTHSEFDAHASRHAVEDPITALGPVTYSGLQNYAGSTATNIARVFLGDYVPLDYYAEVLEYITSTNAGDTALQLVNTGASASTGGSRLELTCDDGAAMGSAHRLGALVFSGAYNASHAIAEGVIIDAQTDSAWTGGSDLPSRLRVRIAQDGSGAVTERMTIKNDGFTGLSTNTPQAMLHVNGSAIIESNLYANGVQWYHDPTLDASRTNVYRHLVWDGVTDNRIEDYFSVYDNVNLGTLNYYVTNGMTWLGIRTMFGTIPRINHGVINIYFADGTYVPDSTSALDLSGFNGVGALNIYGNTNENYTTACHTNQAVILDASTNVMANVFTMSYNTQANINFRNFKIKMNHYTSGNAYGLNFGRNPCGAFVVAGCYVDGTTSASNTYGYAIERTSGAQANYCTVGGVKYGFYCYENTLSLISCETPSDDLCQAPYSPSLGTISINYGTAGVQPLPGSVASVAWTGSGCTFYPNIQTASKTVYLSNEWSRATIQGIIDACPRDLNNTTLTLQFEPGDYSFGTAALQIRGFQNGTVQVNGNNDGSGKYTAQTTKFYASTNVACMYLARNTALVRMSDVAFVMTNFHGGGSQYAVDIYDTSRGYVDQCYFKGITNSNSGAIRVYCGQAYSYQNYFDNFQIGMISTENGQMYCRDNLYTNVSPAYGHYVSGGIIHRYDNQVVGVIDDQATIGGMIIPAEGATLITAVTPYFMYGFDGMGAFADYSTAHNSVIFSDTNAGLTAMFYIQKAGVYKLKMLWRPDSANTSKTMSGLIYLDTTTDSVTYSVKFNSLNWDLAIPDAAYGYTVSTYGTTFTVLDKTMVKASYRKDDNAGGAAGYLRIEGMVLERQ